MLIDPQLYGHEDPGRPHARGKFLFSGGRKLYLKGVTYGPLRSGTAGEGLGDQDQVWRDLARMREAGVNTLRTYEVPTHWFLDAVGEAGLRLLVGLPWEQHITFLDDPARARAIVESVRSGVRKCAGHPVILGYSVGNEIPSAIVRWHGRRRVEGFIERLCGVVWKEDPGALATYVNYPTTEYLQLPFLDFLSFNVFLEEARDLRAYVARLQNLAGNRPLVLTELGLDSRRHGELAQARSLRWQLASAFGGGCAGAFVFSWTDEWYRGGEEVTGWSFGLTTRDRQPKPALGVVSDAFRGDPVPAPPRARRDGWPVVSVVVCTHNGAGTLRECLEGLMGLAYPAYEVIVVDDGSSDGTAGIIEEFPVRVIRTANGGLSRARNLGLAAASGEIIAYIDDDAYPDPHWLHYIVAALEDSDHAGVGGPNIPPPGSGFVAECVARAPGGPAHVLLSDVEAEHLPGCNMAFRVDRLRAVGGFDPVFRVAGDDVDVCWKIREWGWTLGFSPGALVWHHRRGSVGGFLRQQRGYGKAEALLQGRWPEKYTRAGQISWKGRIYGVGCEGATMLPGRTRVYQGTWGTAPFQSLYRPQVGALAAGVAMLDSPFLLGGLLLLALLGVSWSPLRMLVPVLALLVGWWVGRGIWMARESWRLPAERRKEGPVRTLLLTTFLHLAQPVARLVGRREGASLRWREGAKTRLRVPAPLEIPRWTEVRAEPPEWLSQLEQSLRQDGFAATRGGDWDAWDLEVRGGSFAAVRLLMAAEEHGQGRQLLRFRLLPRDGALTLAAVAGCLALAGAAALDAAWGAALVLVVTAVSGARWILGSQASVVAHVSEAVSRLAHPSVRTTPMRRRGTHDGVRPLAPASVGARGGAPDPRVPVRETPLQAQGGRG